MKHISKRLLPALMAVTSIGIDARLFETPLLLYQGYPAGHIAYPLDRYELHDCYEFEVWGAGYYRSAINGYGPSYNDDCGDQSCVPQTASKISISEIVFGTNSFTLAQSFPGGVANGTTNPFVTTAQINLDYMLKESGVFFGFIVGKQFCGESGKTTVGMRVALPYRDREISNDCGDIGKDTPGSTVETLFVQRVETNTAGSAGLAVSNANVWAIRLDFLNTLNNVDFNQSGNPVALMTYPATGTILLGSNDLSGALAASGTPTLTVQSKPPVDVIRHTDGTPPYTVRWADTPVNGATAIAGDGTGLSNLQRGRIASDTVYTTLGATPTSAAQLWVVPNVNDNGKIDANQETILNAINAALPEVYSLSLADFLTAQRMDFCKNRRAGIGDIDLEFYVGHQRCEYAWGELQFGLRLPTGTKQLDPKLVAYWSLGNNGHVECRPGFVFGVDYFDYIKFKADMTYSFVLKRTERLPAPFKGATVRNVSPAIVNGNVSWSYFLADFDFTFYNPCNPCLGATVGYQPYVKQQDKIYLCEDTALDLTGTPQPLDATILTADTHRVAHTIRTEVFFSGQCCKLFGGFSQVIAGENIPRDFNIYLGLRAEF